MKHFFSITVLVFFVACKKDTTIEGGLGVTNLNIINAIPGSSGLVANINNQLLSYNDVQSYRYSEFAAYTPYTFVGGQVALTVCQITDTMNSLYSNGKLDLPNNTNHSLFLTGTLDSPESVLTTDTIPSYNSHDSLTGIRFINLWVGSTPVSVNITGNSNGSEITNLPYKQISGYKGYAAKASIDSYSFELRNVSTGDLITTYVLSGVNDGINGNGARNTVLFSNMTIVLAGTQDNPIVFLVNKWYY